MKPEYDDVGHTRYELPAAFGPAMQGAQSAFDSDALGRALRLIGALLVVASASTFMLQKWNGGDDLLRYAMLVAHGLLLAGAAYFCGLNVRDGRSARTFLALLLSIVPPSFAVLGGLVYSQFHWEPLAALPHYASWIAPSRASALSAVAGTLLLLTPLSVISFVALARKRAPSLTLLFLAANSLLLAPVREPGWIVGLIGFSIVVLSRFELLLWAPTAELRTFEGRLARCMPFIPPLLMAGRVMHLYHPTRVFCGGIALIVGYAVWSMAPRVPSVKLRELSAWASAVLFAVGWCVCASDFRVGFSGTTLLSIGLPCALAFALAASRAIHSEPALSVLALATALATVLLAPIIELTTLTAFAALVTGIAVALWGAALGSRFRLFAGAAVGLIGLVLQVALAAQADQIVRWASLSLTGVLLIVGASYVDRHKHRIANHWEQLNLKRLRDREAALTHFPSL